MGLFDWLSGLFSSKSGEENKDNEGNIERDVSKREEGLQNVYEKNEAPDQAYGDLKAQDEHETVMQKAESEEQGAAEADVQQDKDEIQESSPR
jgi:hypothetical protein